VGSNPTGSISTAARRTTRCHSLTIDRGWQEVAETALAFVKRLT